MRRIIYVFLLFLLMTVGLAAAQPASPTAPVSETPLVLGPVNVVTPTPTAVPPEDPRPAVCSAPFQPGFTAHVIRSGERLADLMVGVLNLTVTQVTALNCLDDASSLPVGAVIWLPEANKLETAQPHDANPNQDSATITRLTASQKQIQNLASVAFSWKAAGTAAYFYACNPDPAADCARPVDAQPVPLTYTTAPISGFRYAGTMRYRLEVVDGAAQMTQDISINITCSQAVLGQYNGLQPCPDNPLRVVTAALQPFQHGLMLWFSATRKIWVMTDSDHRLQIVDDLYHEGDPEPTATAPEGLVKPVRGFGRVWDVLGGADSPLGWATARESGVDVAMQPAGRVSYTTYIQPQDGAIYAVTILPGEANGWWVALSGQS
jgi:hypothetical protein